MIYAKSSDSGSFKVDGNTILTAARFREKYGGDRKGKGSDRELFCIIQPKYCEMLALDPELMLVVLVSPAWQKILRERVDEEFEKGDKSWTLFNRIFAAHAKGYGKIISTQLVEFVFMEYIKAG